MKKLLCLLIMIQFFVFGCSNAGGHFKDYNQAELTDKFQEAGVDPKLPTKFPVEIKEEVFNPPFEDEKVYSVDFLGTKNERFSLQIIEGGNVDYEHRLEKENVEIGKNNGLYFMNDVGTMMLAWTEGDYHYFMSYYSALSETKLTKEDLIETAKSFE